MKKFLKYIFIAATLMPFAASCTFEEESLFSETAAVRMKNALDNYKDILCNASNGWVVEYFPTDTTEGYTFLMKFDNSMKVEMAAQNKWLNNKFTKDSCVYNFVADDGPVLSFPVAGSYIFYGNQIGIFHMFANPESPNGSYDFRGYGLKGDYEFIVQNATSDLIKLKGKKRGTTIYMRKLASDQSWEDYFAQINQMGNTLFDNLKEPLGMIINNETFTVNTDLKSYGSYTNKFRIFPIGQDQLTTGKDVAYIITPTGIRLHSAFASGESKAQTFILNDTKEYLVCSDENQDAKIFNKAPNEYFVWKLNAINKWQISTVAEDMSPSVKAVIDQCKTSLAAAGRTLTSLSFKYNSSRAKNTLLVVFKNASGSAEAYMDYTISNDNSNLAINFAGTYDNNGNLLYTKFDGFSSLTALLSSTFAVTSTTGLNLHRLKLTSTSNPDNWFYVERQ